MSFIFLFFLLFLASYISNKTKSHHHFFYIHTDPQKKFVRISPRVSTLSLFVRGVHFWQYPADNIAWGWIPFGPLLVSATHFIAVCAKAVRHFWPGVNLGKHRPIYEAAINIDPIPKEGVDWNLVLIVFRAAYILFELYTYSLCMYLCVHIPGWNDNYVPK